MSGRRRAEEGGTKRVGPAASKSAPTPTADGRGLRVALVYSEFNSSVVRGLLDGAREQLAHRGVSPADVFECAVPGAFELPLASLVAAESGRFDAVVALGAVVQGGTDHYEHVATAAAAGILKATMESRVPVSFGVLTVRRMRQALERSAPGPENKGAEAAAAAVAQARAIARLRGRATESRSSRRGSSSAGR